MALDNLDKEALIRILTEPKNAITKQYVKLLDLDDVKLTIEPKAVEAIADKALKRKTGARGLRSILEQVMMDIMYNVPSENSISEVIVTKEAVEGTSKPLVVHFEQQEAQ